MANIIDLACEVTGIRARYGKIHDAVFGLSMHRTRYLIRRQTSAFYHERASELAELEERLSGLQSAIAGMDSGDFTKRARNDVQAALLQYTEALAATVEHLKGICHNLHIDEKEYRRFPANGKSRFHEDKILYDYSLQHLNGWGARLNDLFKTL